VPWGRGAVCHEGSWRPTICDGELMSRPALSSISSSEYSQVGNSLMPPCYI
jgi:hypothetical protein